MTNHKARERNKAILADSATGKYKAAQLAKKYNVTKQHIYNLRSDTKKQERLRREKLAAIAKEVMSDPKPVVKEQQNLTAMALDARAKKIFDARVSKIMEDLDASDRVKETQELLSKLSSAQDEIGKLARTCDEQKRLIDDLLGRNKTLLRMVERLLDREDEGY